MLKRDHAAGRRQARALRYARDLRAHIIETHAREGLSVYVQMQIEALRRRLEKLKWSEF